jgi:hypothetical protein
MRLHWIQRVASLMVLAILFVTLSPAKPVLALGGVHYSEPRKLHSRSGAGSVE